MMFGHETIGGSFYGEQKPWPPQTGQQHLNAMVYRMSKSDATCLAATSPSWRGRNAILSARKPPAAASLRADPQRGRRGRPGAAQMAVEMGGNEANQHGGRKTSRRGHITHCPVPSGAAATYHIRGSRSARPLSPDYGSGLSGGNQLFKASINVCGDTGLLT